MVTNNGVIITALLALSLLAGCATAPRGPRVMVLPAEGKPFEVFQEEDAMCRQWAAQQIGISQETLDQNTARSAVAGTAIGAGIGAAIGSISGQAGRGAAIGAGAGMLSGLASGSDSSRHYGWEAQRQYDIAYQQCMYAKGNHIPGVVRRSRRIERMMPPPPDNSPEPYFEPQPGEPQPPPPPVK